MHLFTPGLPDLSSHRPEIKLLLWKNWGDPAGSHDDSSNSTKLSLDLETESATLFLTCCSEQQHTRIEKHPRAFCKQF